jgi:hypothetical protein
MSDATETIDGLDCPRDRFDVGYSFGRGGDTLTAMQDAMRAEFGRPLTAGEWSDLFDGWAAGQADWEAFTYAPVRDEPLPVAGDDTIPW